MALESIPTFPCIKGVVASNQPLAEVKGSVTRGSNLLMTARGGLDVCDGSQVLHDYNGLIQGNFGKVMAKFLFQPTGVPNYYLALIKYPFTLGAPQNLSASASTGGILAPGTFYYKVTALDGLGG